ncbi:hypothetical protein EYF80_007348 [Liparis tanakae]|uniref:Uncharacterized protein n=1 Tax=Liparis tanakae TaxID=230148 RepID=A0A4Z2IZ91_9TELE|nr:hypothetical protein EYF80_007348 [Liparis tanakae]
MCSILSLAWGTDEEESPSRLLNTSTVGGKRSTIFISFPYSFATLCDTFTVTDRKSGGGDAMSQSFIESCMNSSNLGLELQLSSMDSDPKSKGIMRVGRLL